METIYGILSSVMKRKRVGVMRWLVFLSLIVSSFFGSTAFAQEWLSVRFQYTCDGTLHENQTVMWRHPGETFQFLPYEPFCEGKTFAGWVDEAEQAVDENTEVNRNMVVHAVFEDINLYWVTMEYWYEECPGGAKVFDQAIYLIDGKKVRDGQPFVITSPSQTSVSDAALACPGVDASEDIFYPELQSVSITSADLDAATVVDGKKTLTKRVKYVPYTATYSYVYKLKNLSGNGYTEIDRVDNVHGVLGSTVTADVKTFPYANLESTNPTLINRASGQEIEVKYTRKTFQLIFNTNGGSSVSPMSGLYGTSIAKSSFPANPTRTGYDFAGWYTDVELTEPVGNSVSLNSDVNLYAKWTGKTVNYTVVYMREKYDNATNTTEWVYDRSQSASAIVNSSVSSSTAPALTNNINGYERDNSWNESINVKADGSSVLTVRYKLKRYTFVFNANQGTVKMNGSTYTGSGYVVTDIVLGMDASTFWPSSSNEIYRNGRSFSGWNDGHSWSQVTKLRTIDYEYLEKANASNVVTWTAQWAYGSSYNRNVEYYFQQPDGTYKVESNYTELGINSNGLSAKEFDGYTIHDGTPSGCQGNANNACITVTKTEYTYARNYTDDGGHVSNAPNNPTIEREGHIYTFSFATSQTQNYNTSGHASATPSVNDREIEVGGVTYQYVGNTPVEHTHTTSDHAKQTPDESERTITYDGHTWQFKSSAQDDYFYYEDEGYPHRNNYNDNSTITIDGVVYRAYKSERQYWFSGNYKYYYRAPKYTYTYAYTDYTYNYNGTTYTYTWICREGEHEESYTNCGYTYRFYYDRVKKNIVYYDGSTVLKTKEDVMVGANINTNEYNYVPEKPAGKEDYTWGGWYAQSQLVDPYIFGVMPSENLALYAKWVAPQYTVRFEWNYEGADEPFAEDVVDKNSKVNDPGNPNRPHYVFDGWYTAPTGGRRYVIGTEQVTSDITLYAHWNIIPLEYTVRYLSGGPGGEPLFEEKNVRSQVFSYQQVITEEAITIAGYLPDASAKTVSLDYDKANNVIEFYYNLKPTTNKYKVRFVLEGNPNVEVHEETEWEEVDGNMSYITVSAKNVDKAWMASHGASTEELGKDYYPEEVTKIFQLGSDGDNNIFTIHYRDYECVTFNVRCVDVCGNPIPGLEPVRAYIQPNTNYEFSTRPTGYTFMTSYVYDGLDPEPEETHQVSGNLVFWDAPNGPTTLNVDAVFQKVLTITAKAKEKNYDGSPLSSNGVEDVEVSGLEKERLGHSLSSIEFDGEVTNVGEDGLTTPKNAVINGVDCDKEYYLIDYVSAPLNILPAEVLINFDADRWNDGACYDGSPRTIGFRNHGSEIRINNTVYESQHRDEVIAIAAAYSMTETDAGTYTMSISEAEVESQLPNDPNYNVSLAVRPGELTICKAPLTITTSSATKEYDGEALTESTVTIEGLINNQYVDESTVTATATGSQTEVGESVNTYEINWGDVNPNNYVITEDLGILKVTLSCADTTLQTAEDATGCTVEYTPVAPQENNVTEGATFSYKLNGGETVVYPGSSFAAKDGDKLSWSVMIDGAEFSTCEQTIRVEDGTKPVITLDASSEPDGHDWGCNPTVIDPKFTYSDNCEGTGNVPVDSITTKQTTSGCQVTKTWTAHYTDGSGNTADSVSVTYTWTEADEPTIGTIEDVTATAAGGCTYTMPDLSTIVLSQSTDGCGENLTFVSQSIAVGDEYTQTNVSQTIPVTVTVKGSCGLTQTATVNVIIPANDLDVEVTAPQAGCPGASYTFNSSVQGGKTPYVYAWSGDAAGTNVSAIIVSSLEKTKNYTAKLTVTDGNGCTASDEKTLTIEDKTIPEVTGTFADVPATANIAACNYIVPDLTSSVRAQALDNCTATEDLIITQSPAAGDVIAVTSEVTVVVTDKCGNANESTKINVTVPAKTTITITPKSDSKSYDGTPLSAVSTDYTSTGTLMAGDELVASATEVSITNVGTEVTTIASAKIMRGAEDVTCYYDVVKKEGELEIKPIDVIVTISGNKVSVPYDGAEHTASGYTWDSNSDLYDAEGT
ncbi:MAG: InlB B-repeat-containing protein, partial [Paludibacteraceae bacterium]|nr:InlB B-repeat-containing protein [Paludibacteraceae bacterium]MBP5481518.1 InlB B-repeat-containing protein [Paludibacteraceae bacterium]